MPIAMGLKDTIIFVNHITVEKFKCQTPKQPWVENLGLVGDIILQSCTIRENVRPKQRV